MAISILVQTPSLGLLTTQRMYIKYLEKYVTFTTTVPV